MKNANQLLTTMHKKTISPQPAPPAKTDSNPLNDHHIAFFFDILPDFRKLNTSAKREFKITVSAMLNDYLNQYDDEDDSSSKLVISCFCLRAVTSFKRTKCEI